MTADKIDPDAFTAKDFNATTKARIHTFPEAGPGGDDLNVTFQPGVFVAVPRAVGMKLAGIDGFEVRDPSNRRVEVKRRASRTIASISLAPDEIIGRLDELSTKALIARVEKATGFAPPKDAAREQMIEVLMEANNRKPDDEEILETTLRDAA